MRGDDAYNILNKKIKNQSERIKETVNEYLKENPVQSGATEEQAQQIKQNTDDVASLKEDLISKADKTSLVKTDRKLDALWKLNQGISYEFQTDDTEAYQKTVPSGAKVANVKSIGGKTIVWNQLITNARKISFSVKEEQNEGWLKTTNTMCHSEAILIKNHTYIGLLQTDCKNITVMNAAYGEVATGIFTCNNAQRYNKDYNLYVVSSGVNVGEYYFSYMLFDLTQMFGSGNEPSTVEEFEAMFPADYYPYNAGELMSAPVNEVVEQGRNLLNLDEMVKIGAYYGIPIEKNVTATLKLKDGKTHSKASIGFIYNINSGAQARWLLDGGENIKQLATFESNTSNDIKIFGCYPGNVDTINMLLDTYEINLVEGLYTADTMPAYSPYHKTSYPIPQAILNLPGYGWSAGDVRNEVDWENKQYIQRVGKYTIDGSENIRKENAYWVMTVTDFEKPRPLTKNAICVNFKANDNYSEKWGIIIFRRESNGFVFTDSESKFANANEVNDYFQQNNETIYYELNEEQIIDISDIIDNTFQEPIEVEAGGTLMFKNSHGDDYRIPVPSSEEYVISLAEVAK